MREADDQRQRACHDEHAVVHQLRWQYRLLRSALGDREQTQQDHAERADEHVRPEPQGQAVPPRLATSTIELSAPASSPAPR